MRRRYGSGLTKIMYVGAGVFLAVLLIGAIKAPFVVQKMQGSNYLFSEQSELQEFASALQESEIPYQKVSDTGINVSEEWKERAEEIYEEVMESVNDYPSPK